jgi:hypothetical protein
MLPLSSPMKCSFPKSDEEQKKRQREDTITQCCHIYSAQWPSLRTMMLNLKSKWNYLCQPLLITTDRFQKKLSRNTIKVYAGDYPALLYPFDGFDPDDPESGLLRNPILVHVSAIGSNLKVPTNLTIQYSFSSTYSLHQHQPKKTCLHQIKTKTARKLS